MRTPHNERVSSDIVGSGVNTPITVGEAPRTARRKACPERTCILTREVAPQEQLVRLAISPDGQIRPDPLAKAPGRGAWLGVSRVELEKALAKGKLRGALARAFKGAALIVPNDLPDMIEAGLRRILLDRLGIENRAGRLIMGSDRIAEQARAGRVHLLLHAADASDGGRSKLDQAWRVGSETEGTGARGTVMPLDRAALSVALGRENVVHLGLGDKRSAERVDTALTRLMRFTGGQRTEDDETAGGDGPLAAN